MKLPVKGNWGLKLLALILAIILYYALKDEKYLKKDLHDEHDRPFFQYR